MPYPVLVFLIVVGATVGVLIVGAALAVRDRAAEEPGARTWNDVDRYDIE